MQTTGNEENLNGFSEYCNGTFFYGDCTNIKNISGTNGIKTVLIASLNRLISKKNTNYTDLP